MIYQGLNGSITPNRLKENLLGEFFSLSPHLPIILSRSPFLSLSLPCLCWSRLRSTTTALSCFFPLVSPSPCPLVPSYLSPRPQSVIRNSKSKIRNPQYHPPFSLSACPAYGDLGFARPPLFFLLFSPCLPVSLSPCPAYGGLGYARPPLLFLLFFPCLPVSLSPCPIFRRPSSLLERPSSLLERPSSLLQRPSSLLLAWTSRPFLRYDISRFKRLYYT